MPPLNDKLKIYEGGIMDKPMRNFALTGAAGYIAPRHLKAIRDTGNNLVAALDPHDSVGILDSFFENVDYFIEFERFDRHLEKLRRKEESRRVHYVSICSPNYLHDAHVRFALRIAADAICEKPLVLNPWNLEGVRELEKETGRKVFAILQLRLHPSLKNLKEKLVTSRTATSIRNLAAGEPAVKKEVVLSYVTPRGNWYLYSWKGDKIKSGGLSTNIGIHFFDLLLWLFGEVVHCEVHLSEPKKEAGFLELEQANVRWFLSIDRNDLPPSEPPLKSYRSITIDGEEIEFSEGFADLHTLSYQEILEGKGFGIDDTRLAIETAYQIRNAPVVMGSDRMHPFLLRQCHR